MATKTTTAPKATTAPHKLNVIAAKVTPSNAIIASAPKAVQQQINSNSSKYYRSADGSIKAYNGGVVVPVSGSNGSSNSSGFTSQDPLAYTSGLNALNNTAYNTQMSQLEANYNRYVTNQGTYEKQVLANKQLDLEKTFRQANVGYQSKGFTGNSGALQRNIQVGAEPQQLDIANTKTNYGLDIAEQGILKQQKEANLTEGKNITDFTKQGYQPYQSFFNSITG